MRENAVRFLESSASFPFARRVRLAFAVVLLGAGAAAPVATSAEPQTARRVTLRVDPGKVLHGIDEKVYGHFLEHIYFSLNGGLWGELVWNRSFEQNEAGEWSVRDGRVVQESLATNQRFPFGDPSWRDYELTLEARKTGGSEGFLILFRVKSEEEFYWCNLGGWGNDRHAIERGRSGSRWGVVGPSIRGSIETGRWYRIRVRCEGPRFRVWLNDGLVVDFTDDEDGSPGGPSRCRDLVDAGGVSELQGHGPRGQDAL